MVNITTISTLGMHYNLCTDKNKVFSTSLYKIDYILQEQQEVELCDIKEDETKD